VRLLLRSTHGLTPTPGLGVGDVRATSSCAPSSCFFGRAPGH
jgi:hypothetical protein